MAFAYQNYVWDYVLCDPDPEEMRRYEMAGNTEETGISGYISPDIYGGYVFRPHSPADFRRSYCLKVPYVTVPEDDSVPEVVLNHFFGIVGP